MKNPKENYCPLTGNVCNKTRVFFISEKLEPYTYTTSCCRDCAPSYCDNRNKIAASKANVASNPIELIAQFFGLPQSDSHQDIPIRCPRCNNSLQEILQNGRVGCEECYKTFESELKYIIKQNQPGMEHVGKKPKCSHPKDSGSGNYELDIMETALKQAIKEENFERAAYCRDKINQIKKKSQDI